MLTVQVRRARILLSEEERILPLFNSDRKNCKRETASERLCRKSGKRKRSISPEKGFGFNMTRGGL